MFEKRFNRGAAGTFNFHKDVHIMRVLQLIGRWQRRWRFELGVVSGNRVLLDWCRNWLLDLKRTTNVVVIESSSILPDLCGHYASRNLLARIRRWDCEYCVTSHRSVAPCGASLCQPIRYTAAVQLT